MTAACSILGGNSPFNNRTRCTDKVGILAVEPTMAGIE